MQNQRWVILAFVAAAVLVGWTVSSATSSAFAQFAIPDTRLGPITMTTALSLFATAATFGALLRNEKAVTFSDEVVEELIKTTWPTKDETVRASTTVVITTLLVAALLGGYDFIWKNLADYVLLNEAW